MEKGIQKVSKGNTFGKYFSWTTFGESHGAALGVVIDGCPAGLIWNEDILLKNLKRRRPGQTDSKSESVLVSARDESDKVEVLSGVFAGKTLGTPIACIVRNENQRSQDYDHIKASPRVGHADDVWNNKYEHVDYRGGGRSSARETVARVIAGSVAQMWMTALYPNLNVCAFVSQIGDIKLSLSERQNILQKLPDNILIETSAARFPVLEQTQLVDLLLKAKASGESYGGMIECMILNPQQGWGEPVFDKLKAMLAYAIMSIGATTSFEIGAGKDMIHLPGSKVHTDQHNGIYGGIRGGISTGETISFKVGFKPTSTTGENAKQGRHDPCVLPRAVPIVEAMVWAILADLELAKRLNNTLR